MAPKRSDQNKGAKKVKHSQHVGATMAVANSRPPRRYRNWQAKAVGLCLGVIILHPFWAFHLYFDEALSPTDTKNAAAAHPFLAVTSTLPNATIASSSSTIGKLIPFDLVDSDLNIQEPGCLTDTCIQQQALLLARAFPDRTDQAWCIQSTASNYDTDTNAAAAATKNNNNETEGWKGILLVKVPKGASSTSAGVAIRIAKRHRCQAYQWMHRMASEYADRSLPPQSFLWTTVRSPAARAMSTIFFHVVSRSNETATDAFLKMHLRHSTHKHHGAISLGQGGFQLRYTSLTEIPEHSAWNKTNKTLVINPDQVIENVRQTVKDYDFLVVTERMDESLVAMALVMGLDVGDVLVTASKVAGSRYHFAKFAGHVSKCLPTVRSFISTDVQAFLDSNEWRAMNYGDLLLHAAASRSLDQTIQRIGRDRFDPALTEYRRFRALEKEQCAPNVKFPCSNEGQAQPKLSRRSCYLPFYDFGCGYKCIDKLIEKDKARQS